MTDELKKITKELLKTKQVDVIIGHARASNGFSAMPCFIDREKDVDLLIWDAYCVYNLSTYLKDFPGKKKGIIAKTCEVKSIIVLLQESQLQREEVFIIGVECGGVIDEKKLSFDREADRDLTFDERCNTCKPSIPPLYDVLIKQKEQKSQASRLEKDTYETVNKFEAKSLEERFKFWKEEISRCIRCYACRQICPLCYCPTCTADQSVPAWFSKATSFEGNFSWNVMRAMHLAGRCIDCGECERACPVDISLRRINKKIEKDIKELFNYEAGTDPDQKPLLSSFDKNDPEDWIK